MAESDSKTHLIELLEAQLSDSQTKLEVVEKDREALEHQLKSSTFWDQSKNYAIAVLTGIAGIAALALLL